MLYEIRRSGQVICHSSVPDLGYPRDIIKDMEENGMFLYCDGKRVKKRGMKENNEPDKHI